MNASTPTPDDSRRPVSPSMIERLQRKDQEAWRWLLSVLVPVALEGIRKGFQLGTNNTLEKEAALRSAWTSFQRQYLEGELSDPQNLEAFAVHFIRIAYNRWQRAKYREDRMEKAVRNASVRNREGEMVPFDPADVSPGPEEKVIEEDFRAYIGQVIQQVIEEEEIADKKLEALQAYLEDPRRSQTEIAKLVKVSQSTISRWIDDFLGCIRSQLLKGEPG
jgi:hypothetical protein